MIPFETFKSQYRWYEGRRSCELMEPPCMDVEPYGWSIIKKNGNFFVKAYLVGGREVRLPYQEFATIEEAKEWIARYDYERQERFSRRERILF